jgi:predicted transcriptional regulator
LCFTALNQRPWILWAIEIAKRSYIPLAVTSLPIEKLIENLRQL